MATAFALPPGKPDILLFGDGSFQDLISMGSWAFYAPGFDLENAGMEPGPGIDYFEITAVLAGLEAILSIDHTQRPIRIFTDCDCGMLLFQHAIARKRLPTQPIFQRVRHLFDWALHLLSQRGISLTRIGSGSTPENKHCHQLASLKLRSGIAADPALSSQLAMRRHTQGLTVIRKQQRVLRRKLKELEKEAHAIQAKWQVFSPPSVAAPAAAAGSDMDLPTELVHRIRQAAALDVLNAMDVVWKEDELTIRRLFGLPVSRNLWNSSLERAAGSTDVETLEPESE
jgi:ribonuclease HI